MKIESEILKIGFAALIGGASGMASVIFWVADKDNRLEAHGAAIERLHDGQNVTADRLISIDQRLSRIEGKLDVVISGRYK